MSTRLSTAAMVCALLFVASPVPCLAQDGGFAPDQLEQIVAPIALYPDSLLTQVMMAATYPLEIVEAGRWLSKNPNLKGDALTEGMKDFDWDPSVKAICAFPDVVKKMGENLEWTQDLGDAMLSQQTELMDAVQRMRGKAYSSGNLKDAEQQQVEKQQDNIIVIESSDPEVVYVPSYSPTVVYGSWGYPSYPYPALYAPPPPGYGLMAFTAGVAWGAAWSNCNWGWGNSDVNIDIDKQNNFTQNNYRNSEQINRNKAQGTSGGKGSWQHNPAHRQGVNYKNPSTAQKYGGTGASKGMSQNQARGYSQSRPTQGAAGTAQRPSAGASQPGAAQRPSAGASQQKPAGGGFSQPGATQRPSTGTSQRPSTGASQRPSTGSSAYSGSRGSSSYDRSASSRGASSRGSTSYGGSRSSGGGSRPSGGGSRGGGGARGGGGRR